MRLFDTAGWGILVFGARPRQKTLAMLKNCSLATLGLVLIASQPGWAQSPQTSVARLGLLIGLHHRGGDATGETTSGGLRTLWIQGTARGTIAAPVELANLLVPRRSGFWRVGLYGECAEERELVDDRDGATVADHVWAAPVGREPELRLERDDVGFHPLPCRTRKLYCINDWTTTVFWISPEYASLDMGQQGGCGAHPDASFDFTVRSLSDLSRPLSVGQALGQSAGDALRRSYQQARREEEMVHEPECFESADFKADSWHIEREEGTWKAVGWTTTDRLCGVGFDYVIDANLFAVTGRRDDRSRWQQLKSQLPQSKDAHVSPDGKWTFVVTETELIILGGASGTQPSLRVTKASNENVVMVEWATGGNVARWSSEVMRLRNTDEPQPRIIRP